MPAYTRWVNRRAGRILAAAAYTVGLSPNQVTLISGAVSVVGIAILALAPVVFPVMVVVVLLLLLGHALDSADGQVARLAGESSIVGEWLDHVVDAGRLPVFHMAIALALWRSLDTDYRWLAVIGLVFALLVSTWFFAQILAAQLVGGAAASAAKPAKVPADWVSFAKLPSDIGTLYLLVLMLPVAVVFLPAYGLLFGYSVVMAAASLQRRYRQLKALDG